MLLLKLIDITARKHTTSKLNTFYFSTYGSFKFREGKGIWLYMYLRSVYCSFQCSLFLLLFKFTDITLWLKLCNVVSVIFKMYIHISLLFALERFIMKRNLIFGLCALPRHPIHSMHVFENTWVVKSINGGSELMQVWKESYLGSFNSNCSNLTIVKFL